MMRSEYDDSPIIVNTEMRISKIAWNNTGSILAISGG